MFMNGDGLRFALKLFLVGPALLALVLVAHVVWVIRLARSSMPRRFAPVGRVAALALAAVLRSSASTLSKSRGGCSGSSGGRAAQLPGSSRACWVSASRSASWSS